MALLVAPIILLTLGLCTELATHFVRGPAVRAAGRWALLLGALACAPVATHRLCALYDTVRHAAPGDPPIDPGTEPWYRLTRASRLSARQLDDLGGGVRQAAAGGLVAIAAVLAYSAASDRARRRLYWPCLVLTVLATAVLMNGARNAGEFPDPRGPAVSPVRLHVFLAGVTIAAALVALAVSARTITTNGPPAGPARCWLAACALALATAAAGAWAAGLLAVPERIKPLLAQPRDLAHSILGASVVVSTLALAALVRRPRLLALTSALLLAAIAAEIWMGTLLLYDGSTRGSNLFRLTRPWVQTPTPDAADQ